ncbi:hypothetical protein CKAH01_18436 [Colletotrichum kahawae]|uniref:Uncharacterized protein n=1 Tax=Colletotrichum kahawae TaxID=34407 RepID=A0AAD9Y9R9_COLKA|nr:hypothetical protein CKAH01_18436 [Colletotrichum kahawae]
MYQQQRSNGLPPRDSRLTPRQALYLSRLRAVQNGGHQQATGEEMRPLRQPATAPVVQGRDGVRSGSIKSHLPQASSLISSQESSQQRSEMQDDGLELVNYFSDNFSAQQQVLSDISGRTDRLPAMEKELRKLIDSILPTLKERIEDLSVKVESFHKMIESAGAIVVPEALDTDGVDLGDMSNLF